MSYYVKENLGELQVLITSLTGEGAETRREAWLEYAVMLLERQRGLEIQGPWGCLGLWLMEQTPEHLEWLPGIDLRRY
jgi:hypothetical protein